MAIKATGIALTIDYWASMWDKIEVLTDDELSSDDKVPVTEAATGFLRSTAFFAYNEANWSIAKVKTYAGVTLIAENSVSIEKTNRQSLTIVRKDLLEGI